MAMTDRFDLPVTSASAAAVADYVAAVDLLLSADIGADALLERAIAADPDFALAHIARARLLQLQARMAEAREAAARARVLADHVSARERRHVEAMALAIGGSRARGVGDGPRSCRGIPARRAAVVAGARRLRALGLQRAARPSRGAIGIARRTGAALARRLVVSRISRLGPDRDRRGGAGTRLVERSLALNPRNAHGAHQRVHGYFEAGDARRRRRFRRALARTATSAPGICTAICPGIWHCSNWPAATASAPGRSMSTASGRRWRNRRRC